VTDPDAQPNRPSRRWPIPARIYGRVRTSTVLIGVCFVLTALLYDQVRPDPEVVQTGPQPIDTSQYTQQPTYRQPYTEPSTTQAPSATAPSGTEGESSTGADSVEPESSTGQSGASATQEPTYLPGLTVPPQLRSLLPPAPQAPTATGSP